MNNKVFVTGADGFIGSHLTEALVRDGFNVKAMVQYNSIGSWGWLDHCANEIRDDIEVIAADVRDLHQLCNITRDCDKLVHLAALIAIPYSYSAPQSYVDVNVTGTLNVMQAALSNNMSRVIHTSTSEVYGTAQFVPITEMHPLNGQSPYSASKIAADQLVNSFFCSYDLPVVTLRPFNTYGPRQSLRAVIPTIIGQLLAGQTVVKLGAVTPTRDFTYVDDTVSGFLSALNGEDGLGEVFNLGTGYEISIGELAKLIAQTMKKEITVISDDNRYRPELSEVERLCSQNQKFKSAYNWSPTYLGVDGMTKGIQKTIDWMLKDNVVGEWKYNDINI